MFGRKGLVRTVIEMPERAIEFGSDTLFGKEAPRTRRRGKRECPRCDGAGFYWEGPAAEKSRRIVCDACNGTGERC